MKKLLLFVMLVMGFNLFLHVSYAADELDGDLNALLTEEGDDGGNLEELNGENTTDDQVSLVLDSVDTTSAKLTLTPIDGYTTYKVYYSKEGSSDTNEKEVTVEQTDEPVSVELTDLEPNTKYTLVAKAFDDEGNPVDASASDELTIQTKEQQHKAPADNVLYNPTVKVYDKKIVVSYKPGLDVKKVQISISDDGKTFKPVAVVDAATTTTYTIPVEKPGKKYIKLVPVADDGTLGVCKIGATTVDFVTAQAPTKPAEQPKKKEAEKHVGKAKTGPELYLLVVLAIFGYILYARKKLS